MILLKTRLLPLLLLLLIAVGGAFSYSAPLLAQTQGDQVFERAELEIEKVGGGRYSFNVEVATTPAQMAQGLMFRKHLPATEGMLFLHPRLKVVTMWMKNTYIPLDMLFVNEKGVIVRIVEDTVPHSLRHINSGRPVLAVLELKAGTAHRLGIEVGDQVHFKAFNIKSE